MVVRNGFRNHPQYDPKPPQPAGRLAPASLSATPPPKADGVTPDLVVHRLGDLAMLMSIIVGGSSF